jgi:hypothetical protein
VNGCVEEQAGLLGHGEGRDKEEQKDGRGVVVEVQRANVAERLAARD